MASGFHGAVAFLDKLGVYDVVLPFLLVFTMMYAFLEKTKVFGTETYYVDGDPTKKSFSGSRRNLNAMVSFVVAFFVIASAQLVAIINQTLAHMVLLLVLVFCFMLVAGSFHKQSDEGFFLKKPWSTIFMVLGFVVILFIFLNALGWLDPMYRWFLRFWDSEAIASLVLIGLIAGFIALITKEPKPDKKGSSDD